MKKILILFISLTFSVTINGQNKEELKSIMNEYAENYGKPNYGQEFINTKLNPAILKVEKLTCETKEFETLNSFFKMLLKTKGSANELPADILGGIFICKPEAVEKYLTQVYKHQYLKNILEFGFNNKTYNREKEIDNFLALKKRLEKLIKTDSNKQ